MLGVPLPADPRMPIPLLDRYRGCLLGLACGDAVGTTVEFMPRGSFADVTGMTGGGPFGLRAGQWTDDTSMALCLGESLLACGGFDARDQMERYLAWWRHGHLSSTGTCFDIGKTVRAALQRYADDGNPWAGSADPRTAGNGSLMRLAPVVLRFLGNAEALDRHCADSSRTTHAAPEAIECCRLFGRLIANALHGKAKDDVFDADGLDLAEPGVVAIAGGAWRSKSRGAIVGSGYAVESLEAALWCFERTTGFAEAVLAAANLGDDADTTAAIVGQLAGARYGAAAIPQAWLDQLHLRARIESMAESLCIASAHESPGDSRTPRTD